MKAATLKFDQRTWSVVTTESIVRGKKERESEVKSWDEQIEDLSFRVEDGES